MTRPWLAAIALASVMAGWLLFVRGEAPPPSGPLAPDAPAVPADCGKEAECRIDGVPSAGPPAAPRAPESRPAPAAAPEPNPAGSGSAAPPPPPADAAALRAEADRLLAAGDFGAALGFLRRATDADPSAKNHGDLGALLTKLTDTDGAVRHLREAAEKDPGNADRWIALANAHYRRVDLGEAWAAEKRAKQAEPGLELGRDASGMRVRKGDTAPRNP